MNLFEKNAILETNKFQIGYKKVYNYRFLFITLVKDRTIQQEFRFWRYQTIIIMIYFISGIIKLDRDCFIEICGRLKGIVDSVKLKEY